MKSFDENKLDKLRQTGEDDSEFESEISEEIGEWNGPTDWNQFKKPPEWYED